jgi:hypothetical protein
MAWTPPKSTARSPKISDLYSCSRVVLKVKGAPEHGPRQGVIGRPAVHILFHAKLLLIPAPLTDLPCT